MEQTRIAAPSHAGTQEARAARGARRAEHEGEAAGETPRDGFAQLLMALGGAEGEALPSWLPEAPEADPGPATALSLAQEPLAALPAAAIPVTTIPAAAAGVAAAAVAAVAAPVLRAGRAAGESLVGETAWIDGAAEVAAVDGSWREAPSPMASRGAPARSLAAGGPLPGGVRQAAAGPGLAAAGAAGAAETASPVAAGAADAMGTTVPGSPAAGARAMAGWDSMPERGFPFIQQALAAPSTIAVSGGAPAPFAGGQGVGAPAAGEPVGAGAALPEPAGADAPAPSEGAAGAGEEAMADQLAEQIAEQVSYWVHQKTQNAELTLQQGGRAVEVRVALTGDAAHVTFRSDHADARQALDASSAQLRELLAQQGLALAGVTVGASGAHAGQRGAAQHEGAREPQRQGARQAQVQVAAVDGLRAAAARSLGVRRVDLFV